MSELVKCPVCEALVTKGYAHHCLVGVKWSDGSEYVPPIIEEVEEVEYCHDCGRPYDED